MVGLNVKYGNVICVCIDLRDEGESSRRRRNVVLSTRSKVAARGNPPVNVALRRRGWLESLLAWELEVSMGVVGRPSPSSDSSMANSLGRVTER